MYSCGAIYLIFIYQVLAFLTPDERTDNRDVILEISSGVGGQEAMLFSKDMCAMYLGFMAIKRWNTEILVYETVGGTYINIFEINSKSIV